MDDSAPYGLPDRLAALFDADEWAALAFDPVPVKARHDGWTPERQRGFIARLALSGCICASARAVGKTKKAAYLLRDRPDAASFAKAYYLALDWGKSRAVDLVFERALLGEVRPVYYRGRRCGEQLHFDTPLLFAVMKMQPPVDEPSAENMEVFRRFVGDFG